MSVGASCRFGALNPAAARTALKPAAATSSVRCAKDSSAAFVGAEGTP